jgi:hypothetical protein
MIEEGYIVAEVIDYAIKPLGLFSTKNEAVNQINTLEEQHPDSSFELFILGEDNSARWRSH